MRLLLHMEGEAPQHGQSRAGDRSIIANNKREHYLCAVGSMVMLDGRLLHYAGQTSQGLVTWRNAYCLNVFDLSDA